MARKKTLTIAALNIKAEPHSPETYVKLLQAVFEKKLYGKIKGNDYLMLGTLSAINLDCPEQGIKGIFYKFTDIDPNAPWLNMSTLEPIESENFENGLKIPAELKPNLKEIYFVFYPYIHKLIFEYSYASPRSIKTALLDIFSYDVIAQHFGNVNVEIEVSKKDIERLLSLPYKQKLKIKLTMPNPAMANIRKSFYQRLDAMNADTITTSLRSKDKNGIQPDDDIIDMANDTSLEGTLEVTAIEDGKSKTYSTENIPRTEKVKYDPETQPLLEVLIDNSYVYFEQN